MRRIEAGWFANDVGKNLIGFYSYGMQQRIDKELKPHCQEMLPLSLL